MTSIHHSASALQTSASDSVVLDAAAASFGDSISLKHSGKHSTRVQALTNCHNSHPRSAGSLARYHSIENTSSIASGGYCSSPGDASPLTARTADAILVASDQLLNSATTMPSGSISFGGGGAAVAIANGHHPHHHATTTYSPTVLSSSARASIRAKPSRQSPQANGHHLHHQANDLSSSQSPSMFGGDTDSPRSTKPNPLPFANQPDVQSRKAQSKLSSDDQQQQSVTFGLHDENGSNDGSNGGTEFSASNGESVVNAANAVCNGGTHKLSGDTDSPSMAHQFGRSVSQYASMSNSVQFDDSKLSATPTNATLKRRSRSEKRFQRLFQSIPSTEHLLSRFACASVSDMGLLTQGYLYISYNWICFHSNIFGIEKLIEIAISDVALVTKEKTARIIPNAVGVKTKQGKMYLFGSLLSRDNTYQLLLSLVHKVQHTMVYDSPISDDLAMLNSEDPTKQSDECSSLSSESSSETPAWISPKLAVAATSGRSIIADNNNNNGYAGSSQSSPTHVANPSQPTKSATSSSTRKPQNNTTKLNVRPTALPALASLSSLFTWFTSLPKIMAFLVTAVVILCFLFVCATVLTIRLMALHNAVPAASLTTNAWQCDEQQHALLDSETAARMDALIGSVLDTLQDARKQLTTLHSEFKSRKLNPATTVFGKSKDTI